jgi:hypothetical protein
MSTSQLALIYFVDESDHDRIRTILLKTMSNTTPDQQRAFFEAFGFLKLPGLLKRELKWIVPEFEAVFAESGIKEDGTKLTQVVPFIDRRPALSALLDHADIVAAVSNLIGADFNYMGSDGNLFAGDTTWHRDGFSPSNSFIKLALYLDPVTSATGCLRVIPGSHTDDSLNHLYDLILRDSDNVYGRPQSQLPAFAIESEPGDVLLFSHRLLHASFGGGSARRMFTLNLGRRAKTDTEIDDLIAYGDTQFCRCGLTTPYGDAMIGTASATRMVHLQQLPQYWQASVERHKARLGADSAIPVS